MATFQNIAANLFQGKYSLQHDQPCLNPACCYQNILSIAFLRHSKNVCKTRPVLKVAVILSCWCYLGQKLCDVVFPVVFFTLCCLSWLNHLTRFLLWHLSNSASTSKTIGHLGRHFKFWIVRYFNKMLHLSIHTIIMHNYIDSICGTAIHWHGYWLELYCSVIYVCNWVNWPRSDRFSPRQHWPSAFSFH